MSYLLTKLLPLFVYPLGLAITLSAFGLLLVLAGRKKLAKTFILTAIVVLWVSSTAKFADFVMGSLEQSYPPIEIEKIPIADAIVVLGGMTRGTVSGTELSDLDGGIDRLFFGARLFKSGKAPILVLSGGNAEGYQPESEAMAKYLGVLGVPVDAMLLESESRNTYQNGLKTSLILEKHGVNRILLVTSAYHMRRAKAVFEQFGIKVVVAATDYQVVERYPSILDWLPQAAALDRTTKGIKEYIGWWVYQWRGWI